tara:strand:+ start:1578 stop:4538 length:2961 start_codon:yes stop_codon:yes gene_type:complete
MNRLVRGIAWMLMLLSGAYAQNYDVALTQVTNPVKGSCSYGQEVVSVQLNNTGSTAASNVTLIYEVNATVISTETLTGPLAAGATTTFSFATTYDFSTPNAYTIKVYVSSANDNNASNDTVATFIASGPLPLPYYEGFESFDGAWYSGGSNSSWAYGTPNKSDITGAGEGTKCWVNGGLTGSYNANENSYLYTPCFDFSNAVNPEIIFKFIVEIEYSWDNVMLQYSSNGGSWQTYGNNSSAVNCNKQNWYNSSGSWSGTLTSGGGSCATGCGSAGFCGQWTEARHCLSSPNLAGVASVQFRLRFTAGSICQDEGFAIDSVVIREAQVDPQINVVSCMNKVVSFEDATACSSSSLWDFGDGTTSTAANPVHAYSQPGNYTVSLVATGRCGAVDTVTQSFEIPDVELPSDTMSCGNFVTLTTGTGYDSYVWNTSPTDTLSSITVNSSGTYTVTVTQGGCTVVDNAEVFISDSVLTTNVLDGDTSFCQGQSINIAVLNPNSFTTYTWQDGSTGSSYTASSTGLYWVEAADSCYTIRDSVTVTVDQPITVDLGADTTVCAGDVVTLSAGVPNAVYNWNTGETTAAVQVVQAGTYTVTVYAGACSATDNFVLSTLPSPNVSLGADTALCNGENQYVVTAPLGNDSYLWNTGVTANYIIVDQNGDYSVTSTLGNCTRSDTVNIAFGQFISAQFNEDYFLCTGENVTIGPFDNVATYSWSNGSTDSVVSLHQDGLYTVALTNVCGTVEDTFYVHQLQEPQFTLGGDTVLCSGDTFWLAVQTDTITFDVHWNTGADSSAIQVTGGGYYEAEGDNTCGVASQGINVEVVYGPEDPLIGGIMDCSGTTHLVSAENMGGSYYWSTGDTTQKIMIAESGLYWVEVERCGLAQQYDFEFNLYDFWLSDQVFANVFTPNGDGVNDAYVANLPEGTLVYSYELNIFDRWGKEVFKTSSVNEGWDGRNQSGNEAVEGVYFYVAKIESECGNQEKKGTVQLLR